MISAFTKSNVTQKCTVVFAGHSTAIGCNSSGTINVWHMIEGQKTPVYINGNITSSYEGLGFRMETTHEFGERTLVILNATTDMAGKYICQKFVKGGSVLTDVHVIIIGEML